MIVTVGFTGARRGMTEAQKKGVTNVLWCLHAKRVVHGDCLGADADFHEIAKKMGLGVRLRPSNHERQRAFCEDADEVRAPAEPLVRNKHIVSDSEVLIATPETDTEVTRSGTWSTVRQARRVRSPVILVLPDGRIIDEQRILDG